MTTATGICGDTQPSLVKCVVQINAQRGSASALHPFQDVRSLGGPDKRFRTFVAAVDVVLMARMNERAGSARASVPISLCRSENECDLSRLSFWISIQSRARWKTVGSLED